MDKLTDLVEKRNDVDFEAFNLLREMEEDGMLTERSLVAAICRDADFPANEAKEMAEHYISTFSALKEKRRALDSLIIAASVAGVTS